jgi:hypothetical protein
MNAILRQLQQGKAKYDEEWKKDPLGMTDADARHITRTVPLQPTMTAEQLNGWVVQRARDVALAQQHVDPSGANEVPFLRPNKQAMLSQRLAHANPQERQMELQKLAKAFSGVPADRERRQATAQERHRGRQLRPHGPMPAARRQAVIRRSPTA